MKYKSDLSNIGKFNVGNRMRVSDPSYSPDVWCSGVLDSMPGVWDSYIKILDNEMTGGWGDRVSILAVRHEKCNIPLNMETINEASIMFENSNFSDGWHVADFEVGVDGGQAGFYDDECFVKRKATEDTEWYYRISDATLSESKAGTFYDCTVSRSGYGDGGYPCIFHCNENGLVDLAFILFIWNPDMTM